MKKSSTSSHSSQKSKEHQPPKPHKKFVTFQYNHLNCFKSTSAQRPQRCIPPQPKPSPKIQLLKKQAPDDLEKLNKDFSQLRIPRRNRGKLPSNSQQAFNNSILLLQYQTNEDEAQQRQQSPKSQQQNQMVNEVVNSCVRVITQDTEHTSNPISARYTENIRTQPADMHYGINHSFSHSYSSLMVPNYYYYTKSPPTRNKKAVSVEESKMFVIDADNIEVDGRTTIMIRNIPNKYTQELLLRTVQKNHKKKFDFFYLPLDFNNNCNVGYAFINFVHTKFIRDFYLQFHGTEWRKFNSSKVCHICYARIQGTTQLQAHFQNSNVINQKDKRLRPLIGIKNVDNIQSLVNKQKSGDEYQYQQ